MPMERIMYIEFKGDDGLVGPARIGRVTILNKGRSLRYKGQRFLTLSGQGFKSNYVDLDSNDHYWISGCRKDGRDALYANEVEIDEDVREEYWTEIRKQPENKHVGRMRGTSKY